MKRAPKAEKSIPIGALKSLPAVLREHGADPWALLESFGVTNEALASPLSPLSTVSHGRILESAAKLIDCEHLGLLLGQRATLDNAGPLRFLVLNAPTVREAVESLIRFCGVWYRGLHVSMTEDEGYACMSLSIDGGIPGARHLLTAYLAANVRILELILGRTWRPTLVRIAYRKPKASALYEQYFQAPVWFGQAHYEVLFPQSLLDQPRSSHDQQLGHFLHQHMTELEARQTDDFSARVRQVIETLLPTGCTSQKVAEFFAIHRFTLYRHLDEQHTSYEKLLEDVRRNLANQLLSQTDLQIAGIATRLGYESQGNFTRAFKRWNGRTPTELRRNAARLKVTNMQDEK
ncbi:AraC-like DNA-binding protein [Paraburkholderia sp. BL6665CI2N2]|uniref:AraC family transcriptional regulator n=1 Tax=Paraburkholderia sp. BL6665CI2N2 TaxID=1938806 RepID=UPI00106559BD|nr:AraC family transcriptional regulator [Paraburkholderia sp. BL6665CI2N2]TDY23104.1 AraC-like DNA-binding protein [Paraburkholderia sp. BL6665CI2N2]